MSGYPLDEAVETAGGRLIEVGTASVVSDFGAPKAEYDDALQAAGLYDARDRGLIEITGNDRASWLHNLVTNAVKTLRPGEGNYAFATNAKGRILFDGNIVVLADRIWFDVDRRYAAKALAHFDRYIITEDVSVRDRSDEYCRMTLLGPRAADIAGALGATQARVMASIGSTTVPLVGKQRLLVRNDFAGVLGLELYVESADAAACWQRLLEIGRPVIRPVGQAAVDVLRIEAGIPVYGQDIDEETLPAETQQLERAVSFSKGCYLGQEVVERMRSRGALARKLVGLKLSGTGGVHPGNALNVDGVEVGRLTSLCESYAAGGTIGLGYIKSSHAVPGTVLTVESTPAVSASVHVLPFRT
jgi:folate-binding protein YgfZ